MNNLDPEVRKFLLYTVSETFAEIKKFVEFKQYDRQKAISGLQEICVLFDLKFVADEKTEEHIKDICRYCGKKKINLRRGNFPFHVKCEIAHRNETQKRQVLERRCQDHHGRSATRQDAA
jgi:hypothetical protein